MLVVILYYITYVILKHSITHYYIVILRASDDARHDALHAYSPRRHQTCHFRKRATSVPAEGPAYGPDFVGHFPPIGDQSSIPLLTLTFI